MVSFYPGPSQLDPNVPRYLDEALASGLLSQNHRSKAFMDLYEDTVQLVRSYFEVPSSYSLYFVSSATECWEILSQDLGDLRNLHLYNGAFGEKGFRMNRTLHPNTVQARSFDQENTAEVEAFDTDVIHLTQNETSNGTELSADFLHGIRQRNPNAFITVDATSSFGGITLPIASADVWFASVQKCLGLPSGMALLICSKKIVDYCNQQAALHYNSIRHQEEQFVKRQTTHTPNTLGIYLLYRSLKDREALATIDQRLTDQAKKWYALFEQTLNMRTLINNAVVRSRTVIAVSAEPSRIESIKQQTEQQGFILGNGYGTFKENTFRIANFPAHQASDIKALHHLISIVK